MPLKMSASFPVKCHLPLITSRIEFKFNALPTPPQITPRRDFGAHIRRQNRRDSVSPYSTSTRFRDITPARSHSVVFGRSDTPSDLSSDDDKGSEKIPKPHGEVGRTNGGYDLQTALVWEYEQFNKFCVRLLSCYLHLFIVVTEVYQWRGCRNPWYKETLQQTKSWWSGTYNSISTLTYKTTYYIMLVLNY